jgi:hypothetical protein
MIFEKQKTENMTFNQGSTKSKNLLIIAASCQFFEKFQNHKTEGSFDMNFFHKIWLGGYVIKRIFKILELEVVWFLKFDKLKSKLSWGFPFCFNAFPFQVFRVSVEKIFGSGFIRVPQGPSSQSTSGSPHF